MAAELGSSYKLGDFLLDLEKQQLTSNGNTIHLARKPFQVLLYLIEHRERLVSRRELLEQFWDGREVYDSTLTQCVGAVRKALDDSKESPAFIETRWGIGYQYIGPFEIQNRVASPEVTAVESSQELKEATQAAEAKETALVAAEKVSAESPAQVSEQARHFHWRRMVIAALIAFTLITALVIYLRRSHTADKESSQPPMYLSPATLPGGGVGFAYNQAITAHDGTAPYSFIVSNGALPDGLTLDSSSGLISGTSTTAATYSFTVTAHDHSGLSTSQSYTVTISTYTCTLPPSSLVAWYPGDGNDDDISGNGNNALLQGGVTFVSGEVGQAFSFNGEDSYVQIPRLIQDDFTIEFWMKTTQTGYQDNKQDKGWFNGAGLVDAEVSGVMDDFGVSLGNGPVMFGTGHPDVTIRSTNPVNDGVWHHIAATRVRSTGVLTLYVDGVQVATGIGGIQSLTSPAYINFGRLQSALHYYDGLLDEPTIYNRALSLAEIQAIFNAGRAGKCKFNSIAVLPIRNLTDDPANDDLSDGITESLINALSRTHGLRVISRGSVQDFKGQDVNPQEAGRKLGVGAVVEGSLRKSGDQVSVSVRLVSVADGHVLWAGESYNLDRGDALAVEDEIARQVVAGLKIKLRTHRSSR